jgi:hypothetical protein
MSERRPKGKLSGAWAKQESTVTRLYCTECGSMQDARKVGRSAEYTLPQQGTLKSAIEPSHRHGNAVFT